MRTTLHLTHRLQHNKLVTQPDGRSDSSQPDQNRVVPCFNPKTPVNRDAPLPPTTWYPQVDSLPSAQGYVQIVVTTEPDRVVVVETDPMNLQALPALNKDSEQ